MSRVRIYSILSAVILGIFFPALQTLAADGAAAQFDEIKAEYEAARKKFDEAYGRATTDTEREKAAQLYPQAESYIPRVLEVAKKEPGSAVGREALLWALQNGMYSPEAEKAIDLLMKEHVESSEIAPAIPMLAYSQAPNAERFLRTLMEKNPSGQIKAQATYTLGSLLKNRLDEGSAQGSKSKEAEELFEKVLSTYASEKELVKSAKGQLFEMRNLAVGKVAPEIEGEDVNGTKFKLTEYRGRVVVLDFWGDW